VKTAKLPWYIRQECLCIVKGYDARVKRYLEARQDIIESSGGGYTRYQHTEQKTDPKTKATIEVSEERWSYNAHQSGSVSNPTEVKAFRLADIETWPETQKMRAVEHAKLMIGEDLAGNDQKQALTKYIMLSCTAGRKYPFRYFDLPGFSQRDFYRRRDDFLLRIAEYLEMI
jgi:hypothetical protein